MAGTERDMQEARSRQLQADVLIHETYTSPTTSAEMNVVGDPNVSSASYGSTAYIPTDKEIEHYTRILNNPGAVMPHGVLLMVDESANLKIKGVSQNCVDFFGLEVHEMLGTSIQQYFDNTSAIEAALAMKDLTLANPVSLGLVGGDGTVRMMVNLILHRVETGLCIDIEELDPYENAFAFHQRVRQAIDRLQQCETAEAMFQRVSEEFFLMSGYDRVMMYKFHEDYHGEVMTEFCTKNITDDTWLGLHYPATDIPQRSRDQFKASSVRIIVNCQAPDSPIIMADGEAGNSVPMTMSSLRPAHSCHKEYLVNMGVTASIATAIIVKDQLWGLMIGHHMKPKFVSFQMRMACEFLVQAFSMALTNLLDSSAHARHERSLQLHSKLCDLMYQQGQNPGLRVRGLVTGNPSIMDLIPGVTGAAAFFSSTISTIGDCPPLEDLTTMVALITEQWNNSSAGRQHIKIECLEDIDVSFASFATKCAGALCVPIGDEGMLIWFRPEVSTTIRWGGNIETAAVQKHGIMHPRASFEVYSDSVKGRSTPWLKWELDAADGLGHLAKDILRVSDDDNEASGILNRLKNHEVKTKTAVDEATTELIHLIDSVKSPIFGVDNAGNIIQWNQMVAAATGHNRTAVIGKRLDELLVAQFVPTFRQACKAAMQGETTRGVYLEIVNLPNGATMSSAGLSSTCVLANASARYNAEGLCVGVVLVCTDVSMAKASGMKQKKMNDKVHNASRIAQSIQPNGLNATEDNFAFEPNKEDALLGEGAFGKTYKMRSHLDEQLYAVKMINVQKAERNGLPLENLKREVQMLLRLAHKNVIRYYTCYMHKNGKFFCIVMELAKGGTWSSLVSKIAATNEQPDAKKLTIQLCDALSHIHSKRMIHRDMKPDNVLFGETGDECVKITDFGLACVTSANEMGTRAGTLTYASPEKAGAKSYTNKDDMWAVGCMLSELLTGVSIPTRCGVGIFAFNRELVDKTIADCTAKDAQLGKLVGRLLAQNADDRPSAAEVLAELSPKPKSKLTHSDFDDLLEEYNCSICQSLVLDAHTVCEDEHIFCRTCLDQWMENSRSCPECRKPAFCEQPLRLRVINNAVEKLAPKALSAELLKQRKERQDEEEVEMRSKLEKMALDAELAKQGPVVASGESQLLMWNLAEGKAQYGSACTVFKHKQSGLAIEVFHGNGWFRFRTVARGTVRWCNSCGNLGESDFGAPDKVRELDDGQGRSLPPDGQLPELEEGGYWTCKIHLERLELRNADEESLILTANGGFVWLSHTGVDVGVVWMPDQENKAEAKVLTHAEAQNLLNSGGQ